LISLEFIMSTGLISLAAGVLIGLLYALLKVRSPAPPAVALIGLLGRRGGDRAPRHFLHADDTAQKVPVTLSTGASS